MIRFGVLLPAALTLLAVPFTSIADGEVNVYSNRQPQLIEPMWDIFTEQTGIRVNSIFAKKGLVERLKTEAENSPADLIFTVDIGRLTDAVSAGVTQSVSSDVLNKNIPRQYRDPAGHWFGLTTRGRVIIASKERVPEGAIKTYQELADPRWKGKICSRSGKHAYNVALTASIMAHAGEQATRIWLQGLKENLARSPQGNDRAQARAVFEGLCDVAIINTYYMGNMLEKQEQRPWAESVYIIFPNQADRGVHLNVSGMAMAANSPNRENAIKLMEFLAGSVAQKMYADQNHEFPVKVDVPRSDIVASWGDFRADDINIAEYAKYRSAASKLADEVGFDN